MLPNGASHWKPHILCVSRALSPRGLQASSVNDKPSASSTLFESGRSHMQSQNSSTANSPNPKQRLKTDSANSLRRAGIKLVDRVGSKQSMMGARSRLGSLTAELEQAQRELRDMERLRIENNTLKQENQVLRDMMHKSEWERRERDRLEEAARQRMHQTRLRQMQTMLQNTQAQRDRLKQQMNELRGSLQAHLHQNEEINQELHRHGALETKVEVIDANYTVLERQIELSSQEWERDRLRLSGRLG